MNKIILTSVALSAALFAGHASAFTAVPVIAVGQPKAGTPDWASTTLAAANRASTFIDGSSAATPFFIEALRERCESTQPIYRYTNGNQLAFLCSKADSYAGVAQPFLIMHKRDQGGSIAGIRGAQGTTSTFLDEAGLNVATSCPDKAAPNPNLIKECTGGTLTTTTRLAEAHFSDVEPALFASPLNGAATNLTGVAAAPTATIVFGVAVTKKLRDAMQEAMVAGGVLPASCVNNETQACMPNLTTAQLTSIWAQGHTQSWDDLRYDGVSAGAGLPHSIYGIATTFPTQPTVHICSRTAGSGTLATFQAIFENAPCNGTLNEAIQAATAATIQQEPLNTARGKFYHSNSSTGTLEDCLIALDNGASSNAFTFAAAVAGGASEVTTSRHRWAIGILATDGLNVDNSKAYRFIKIDNAAPTLANVVNGRYKYWAELVQVGSPTADAFAQDLVTQISTPSLISRLNQNYTWGLSGFLGHANNAAQVPTYDSVIAPGTLVSAAFDSARPVNPYSRTTGSGASLSHCRLPTIPNGSRAMPVFYPAP